MYNTPRNDTPRNDDHVATVTRAGTFWTGGTTLGSTNTGRGLSAGRVIQAYQVVSQVLRFAVRVSDVVPVPRFLVPLLETELAGGKDGDGLVFPSRRGGYLTESELRWVFDPAATAIGVDGLTPHELRHTCASLAIAEGANVTVLGGIADAFDAAAQNTADWLRTGPGGELSRQMEMGYDQRF
jgi:integrase